jgi:hypothetical protein
LWSRPRRRSSPATPRDRAECSNDYRPPPSCGPCDQEARKTVENWRRLKPYAVVGLGLVLGAAAVFLFVDTS